MRRAARALTDVSPPARCDTMNAGRAVDLEAHMLAKRQRDQMNAAVAAWTQHAALSFGGLSYTKPPPTHEENAEAFAADEITLAEYEARETTRLAAEGDAEDVTVRAVKEAGRAWWKLLSPHSPSR